MGKRYAEHINPKATPQSKPIPGRESEMKKNLAGGYAFEADDWTRLDRWLILGSEGGTYYIREPELTVQNAQVIRRCLKEDGARTVMRIVEISKSGRAAKNDPALFALAMAATPKFSPDSSVRGLALSHLPTVARIGTHLFTFVSYINTFRGWGRQLRDAISHWYNSKRPDRLAYQMAKYQQRGGWSHHDVLHLAHPKPSTDAHDALYAWAKTGGDIEGEALRQIHGMHLAKQAKSAEQIISLINEYRLTREMIPTQWFNNVDVWAAMLEGMPLFAMLRNLGKMTQIGLLAPMSEAVADVTTRLTNEKWILGSNLHPWNILNAHYWYGQGRGMFGSLTWKPNHQILDALDRAFYLSFGGIEPSNKRVAICIDVSGSMTNRHIQTAWNKRGNTGVEGMDAMQAAAAMSMVTARTEPNYMILMFDTQWAPGSSGYSWNRGTTWRVREAKITKHSTLGEVTRGMKEMIAGGTDYAGPMLYAIQERIPIDAFVLFGDEQTWAGSMHPTQAMEQYRREMRMPGAKLAVVHMCSTATTVADPKDALVTNYVGFDTNTPKLIADFIRE